jgi:hypothetical protein
MTIMWLPAADDRAEQTRRRLRLVRWLAIADALLLVALVASSLSGRRDLVSVLGPLHGANFLVLLVVVGTATVDGLWSWWFPLAVLVTGGPLGALVGEWVIGRRLAATAAPTPGGPIADQPPIPGARDSGDIRSP